MSASSSVTLRCAERRTFRLVSSAIQRSTRLIHEALVGVKCRNHFFTSAVFAGGVVVADQVQVQPGGNRAVYELEEPYKLLVAVPPVEPGECRQVFGPTGRREFGPAEWLVRGFLARLSRLR